MSVRTVSDLERGVNGRPRRHTARLLADALGLEGDDRRHFEAFAETTDEGVRGTPGGGVRAGVGAAGTLDATPTRPTVFAPLDRFFGDESLVNAVRLRLESGDSRLVTLIGPGGVGKTRLALEVASRLSGAVCLVELAAVADAALVPAAIGRAVGYEHGPGRSHLDSVIAHLGAQPMVLVIDNFEQVMSAAGVVAQLLWRCRELVVLVTSRTALRVAGEVEVIVPPLGFGPGNRRAAGEGAERGEPSDDWSSAVELFIDRATARGVTESQLRSDIVTITELCRRLDGLPLAVELAAARARVVAPADMLTYLEQALDFLRAERGSGPPHHRTMRATLEWSYDLLSEPARAMFRSLGVLAKSGPTEIVVRLLDAEPSRRPDLLDQLQELEEAHLIRVVDHEAPGGSRVELLETARQYASELLAATDERDRVAGRFTEWALGLVRGAQDGLTGPSQGRWLDRIELELPNLRVARDLLLGDGSDVAIDAAREMAAGLWRYWEVRSQWTEGVAWLSAVLVAEDGSPRPRGDAHRALGVMHRGLGQLADAEEHGRAALEQYQVCGDRRGIALCTNNLANVAFDRCDFAVAVTGFTRAVELSLELGDEMLSAMALHNAALAALELGRLREAVHLLRSSRRIAERHNNVALVARLDSNVGRA